MQARVDAYAASEPGRRFPGSIPRVGREQGRDVLYGVWLIGNDYRNRSGFYGAYPPGYLERVWALFPDVAAQQAAGRRCVLHVFSGALPPGPYTRLDLKTACDIRGSVYDAPRLVPFRPRLVLADPPYSATDALQYGTPGVDRRRAMEALAMVVARRGFLCWLDTCWPMHSKGQWLTVGRIFVQRSTNHRVRVLSMFQRAGAAA
jgi:hypothetical protein